MKVKIVISVTYGDLSIYHGLDFYLETLKFIIRTITQLIGDLLNLYYKIKR